MAINSGIVNPYTIQPKNLAQYAAMRGVPDLTQLGQFEQFEKGYYIFAVLKMPRFMEMLADEDPGIKALEETFRHTLETEFRGLDGLPDIDTDPITVNLGGNAELQMIGNVNRPLSVNISMPFYEKKGNPLTKYAEVYVTGIKDPSPARAKTYHGLIAANKLEPGWENEVFTFMYIVTDNTYLRIERAVLLANAQLTNPQTSIYNGEKGQIDNQELSLQFTCYPIYGVEVDKAASKILADTTGNRVTTDQNGIVTYNQIYEPGTLRDSSDDTSRVIVLDSQNYNYAIMNENDTTGTKIDYLVEAKREAENIQITKNDHLMVTT